MFAYVMPLTASLITYQACIASARCPATYEHRLSCQLKSSLSWPTISGRTSASPDEPHACTVVQLQHEASPTLKPSAQCTMARLHHQKALPCTPSVPSVYCSLNKSFAQQTVVEPSKPAPAPHGNVPSPQTSLWLTCKRRRMTGYMAPLLGCSLHQR